MTFPKSIKNTMLKDESVIKMASQKSPIVGWAIVNFLIPILLLVSGVALAQLKLVTMVNDFLTKYPFVYYIFIVIMGLWLLIVFGMFIHKLNTKKPYNVYLTNRRVLITRGNMMTTILFPAILGVAMRKDEDESYSGVASIEIHTANKIYEMKNMKGGNQVIGVLLQILFGSTIEVTKTNSDGVKTKENFSVDKKVQENKSSEKVVEVKRMDTAPITPKPLVNDKIHSAIGEKEESKEEHQSNHEK